MVYGIDLGTTNSILALKGELITELVPSIASIDKKMAGKELKQDMEAIRSFKRDMTIESEGSLPILASSLVLRELLIQAKAKGHVVKDVVISVPAYFKDPQRQATKKAATQLGLNVLALINEPTAAAIALGQSFKGLYLVFDLGGGTFDVTIIDSRFGNYDVIATDGVPLGGDDLDRAIMAHIISESGITAHHLGNVKLQQLLVDCEKLKRHIVSTQTDAVLDLTEYPNRKKLESITLTTRMYERIVRNTFKDCIIKMKELTANYINTDIDEYELIFVGGSTKCPYLRKFAEDANGKPALAASANPDTVIAEGASLYADMVATGEDEFLVSDVTTALRIGLADGTTEVLITENSKLPASNKIMISNGEDGLEGILYDLYQGNSLLAKNNEQIGQLRYPLKKYYDKGKFRAWATIEVDRSGLIKIGIQEPLSEPVYVEIAHTSKGKLSE